MPGPIYVLNEDPQSFAIQYEDHGDPARQDELKAQWQSFNRPDPTSKETYKILTRKTNPNMEVMVDHYLPPGTPSGNYRIETFVPGKHATSRKAIFSILRGAEDDEQGQMHLMDMLMIVDLNELRDVWISLGDYYLEPNRHPDIGRVRQYDLSREDPPEEISFGPVRWVPLDVLPVDGKRFDSPVGNEAQRNGPFPSGRLMFGHYPAWAGDWFDVNPYLTWYINGYHTGADLNLPGSSGVDKGKPVYAIGDGLVTYAGQAGSWGNVIVIEHPNAQVTLPDGTRRRQTVFSRYGHVDDNILVHTGDRVKRGQNIGFIGLPRGQIAGWHLHFDVSYTDILKHRPSYWPNQDTLNVYRRTGWRDSNGYRAAQSANMREVVRNFVDPLRFIQENHSRNS